MRDCGSPCTSHLSRLCWLFHPAKKTGLKKTWTLCFKNRSNLTQTYWVKLDEEFLMRRMKQTKQNHVSNTNWKLQSCKPVRVTHLSAKDIWYYSFRTFWHRNDVNQMRHLECWAHGSITAHGLLVPAAARWPPVSLPALPALCCQLEKQEHRKTWKQRQ